MESDNNVENDIKSENNSPDNKNLYYIDLKEEMDDISVLFKNNDKTPGKLVFNE